MMPMNLTLSEFIHYVELGLFDNNSGSKQLYEEYQKFLNEMENRHKSEILDLEDEISCLKCEIENLEQDLCSECSGRKR